VQGDRIILYQEECASAQGYEFHDDQYSFELSGDSIRFTTISNACPDHVAETILTSRPWTRVRR
jgi:hypothetical protein